MNIVFIAYIRYIKTMKRLEHGSISFIRVFFNSTIYIYIINIYIYIYIYIKCKGIIYMLYVIAYYN